MLKELQHNYFRIRQPSLRHMLRSCVKNFYVNVTHLMVEIAEKCCLGHFVKHVVVDSFMQFYL